MHSIKILRELDGTGVLLEAVSSPTRQYLQTRKDAIRCIVSAMTDDSAVAGESLYDELHRPTEQVGSSTLRLALRNKSLAVMRIKELEGYSFTD